MADPGETLSRCMSFHSILTTHSPFLSGGCYPLFFLELKGLEGEESGVGTNCWSGQKQDRIPCSLL